MTEHLLDYVFDACRDIGHNRTHQFEILASMCEEMGELATEVQIELGTKNREVGPDGVAGEAVDVILCALDMFHTITINHTREERIQLLKDIIYTKTDKWVTKYANPQPKQSLSGETDEQTIG